ncbi:MAG: glycoside hydrolase family 127 protein, partial [Propionibacterium sp.]|nr:glycoside hydrolase family 127 protein [Propionibacterium sp.]
MEVERPGVTQRDEGTGPRLSRRSFLEGAVLAGAAFGGAGLLGRGAPAQAAALPDIGMDAAQPAVARGLTTPLSHVRRAQSASFEPDVWVRRPFALSEVTIDGGVYRRGRDQGMVLARAYSVDTILAVFRRNAGLDTKGATPPGGWEEPGPAPDAQRWGPSEYKLGQNKGGAGGLLRGHYGGHFLTMLSMAYACSGEEALKDKVAAVVSGLKECQRALAAQTVNGAPRYSHPGYLSAYGEWQFSALEEYAPYGE